ncbi:MAG: hypothetical protein F4X26_01960, partial [Chloroflexi bacterium]|nr:hypothetical protein [Chloroflexota bacterium]
SGPAPSEVEFEWNVKRDIEALDPGNSIPTGAWSTDGVLWIADNAAGAGDAVYAYDLATGERVAAREFSLHERNGAPRGIWADGVTAWVADSGRDRLFAYDLASGRHAPERDIALDSRNADARGLWGDEGVVLVLDGRDALFAYDLAGGALLGEYALDEANADPRDAWSDGVTLWVSDHGAKRLFAYRLPEPPAEGDAPPEEPPALERVRGEEFEEPGRVGNNSPRGIWSDGEVMYVADELDERVYSYNMPDGINARLASLTLDGVDIGEFDPGRTEYEGVVGEGVTETVVAVVREHRRAAVVIEPPDADGHPANGHQLALAGLEAVTVTVTSEDGSRTRVYRVTLDTEEEPWAHCLKGAVAAGFSLVVSEGGSVDELAACAESRGISALYALHEGSYLPYILGAPNFVNRPFAELFAASVPALTPLVAASAGPAGDDPVGEVAPGDWPACLHGEVAEGWSLVVYEGGSVDDLAACAEGRSITALYVLHEGEWVSHIMAAPEFVNRSFAELYADGVPSLTPLVVRSGGPPGDDSDGDRDGN